MFCIELRIIAKDNIDWTQVTLYNHRLQLKTSLFSCNLAERYLKPSSPWWGAPGWGSGCSRQRRSRTAPGRSGSSLWERPTGRERDRKKARGQCHSRKKKPDSTPPENSPLPTAQALCATPGHLIPRPLEPVHRVALQGREDGTQGGEVLQNPALLFTQIKILTFYSIHLV